MESENKHGGKSSNCKTEDIGYHVNPGGMMLGVYRDIWASLHTQNVLLVLVLMLSATLEWNT